MTTYTRKPRPVEAIRYSEGTEQQIIDALGATKVTRVVDEKERKFCDDTSGVPVFTVSVFGGRDSKVPSGDYTFNTGDYLVLSEGGIDGEWESFENPPTVRAAEVMSSAKFHRLYESREAKKQGDAIDVTHKLISDALDSARIEDADLHAVKVRAVVTVKKDGRSHGTVPRTQFVNIYSTHDPLHRAGLDAPSDNGDIWG